MESGPDAVFAARLRLARVPEPGLWRIPVESGFRAPRRELQSPRPGSQRFERPTLFVTRIAWSWRKWSDLQYRRCTRSETAQDCSLLCYRTATVKGVGAVAVLPDHDCNGAGAVAIFER